MSVFFDYFVMRDGVDVAVDRILRISIYHPPPLLTPSLVVLFCFFSRPYPQFSITSDSYLKSVRA